MHEYVNAHQALMRKIHSYKREFDQGELAADLLLEFLIYWLENHIADMDKSAAAYYKNKEKSDSKGT